MNSPVRDPPVVSSPARDPPVVWCACAACGTHKPLPLRMCYRCSSGISVNIGPTRASGHGIYLTGADFARARQLLSRGACMRHAVVDELDRFYSSLERTGTHRDSIRSTK